MNPEVLDKVLACNRLPTLPAVAMRVVELTNRNDLSIKALADTISNDPALTVKVLRTVNSSLFGLRQKCSNINQAIVLLGLSAVKTLALGFSLVAAIQDSADDGFDMAGYWRRALYTAMAAKAIARHAELPDPDECFLGGLLQDIGMLALHLTLGAEYAAVLAPSGGDHREVVRLELAALATQHPEVGAMLAQRWKLPDALVMPVRYHERPTAAPQEHQDACRAVGLGNIAADLLSADQPAPHLVRFRKTAEQWFGINAEEADELIAALADQAREAATLLRVSTGPLADASAVLARATAQIREVDVVADAPACLAPEHDDPNDADELTGAANRSRFNQSLVAAVEQARVAGTPLALAMFQVVGLDAIARDLGPDARDNVLITVASRLARACDDTRAMICRYDAISFAVLMPQTDRFAAARRTEELRNQIGAEPLRLIVARDGGPPEIRVTTQAGLAAIDAGAADDLTEPHVLAMLAETAVGGDALGPVRVLTPSRQAA